MVIKTIKFQKASSRTYILTPRLRTCRGVDLKLPITYAVGVFSKFCSKPSKSHLATAKRVLRYLKETQSLGLK